jgi:hypothetical protein
MKQQPFGRRTGQAPTSIGGDRHPANETAFSKELVEQPQLISIVHAPDAHEDQSVDDELREWKRTRRKFTRLPWRQISFTASICFGVGSFVLPDSVNHTIQWLLLALGAASLVAGFSSRHQHTQ